jgi:arsenate reductase
MGVPWTKALADTQLKSRHGKTPPMSDPASEASTPAPESTSPAPDQGGPAFPRPKRDLFGRALRSTIEPVKRFFERTTEWAGGIKPTGGVRRSKYATPRVMFVDAGNAGRSQMAEAYAKIYGFHAESGGLFPMMRVAPEAVEAMAEAGIDISHFYPKILDVNRLEAFDRVISMGNDLPAQYRRLPNVEAWNILDPTGLPVAGWRDARIQCERHVKRLAKEFRLKAPEVVEL